MLERRVLEHPAVFAEDDPANVLQLDEGKWCERGRRDRGRGVVELLPLIRCRTLRAVVSFVATADDRDERHHSR